MNKHENLKAETFPQCTDKDNSKRPSIKNTFETNDLKFVTSPKVMNRFQRANLLNVVNDRRALVTISSAIN